MDQRGYSVSSVEAKKVEVPKLSRGKNIEKGERATEIDDEGRGTEGEEGKAAEITNIKDEPENIQSESQEKGEEEEKAAPTGASPLLIPLDLNGAIRMKIESRSTSFMIIDPSLVPLDLRFAWEPLRRDKEVHSRSTLSRLIRSDLSSGLSFREVARKGVVYLTGRIAGECVCWQEGGAVAEMTEGWENVFEWWEEEGKGEGENEGGKDDYDDPPNQDEPHLDPESDLNTNLEQSAAGVERDCNGDDGDDGDNDNDNDNEDSAGGGASYVTEPLPASLKSSTHTTHKYMMKVCELRNCRRILSELEGDYLAEKREISAARKQVASVNKSMEKLKGRVNEKVRSKIDGMVSTWYDDEGILRDEFKRTEGEVDVVVAADEVEGDVEGCAGFVLDEEKQSTLVGTFSNESTYNITFRARGPLALTDFAAGALALL